MGGSLDADGTGSRELDEKNTGGELAADGSKGAELEGIGSVD